MDVDDGSDSVEILDEDPAGPLRKGKGRAADVKRRGQGRKRDLQESPTQTRSSAKRARVERGSRVINLGDMVFDEGEEIDLDLVPALKDQVRSSANSRISLLIIA